MTFTKRRTALRKTSNNYTYAADETYYYYYCGEPIGN